MIELTQTINGVQRFNKYIHNEQELRNLMRTKYCIPDNLFQYKEIKFEIKHIKERKLM